MRDAEKTVGNMIDKLKTAFIGSIDNARFFRGVMLRGTMEVLTDSASKEMIWQEGDTMYYPEGVTDPDYCVLKFTATSGRFYSGFKSESFMVE